ncbi:hypothetical protein PMIN06_003649 [Paraphaeosphaeria minitans]
MKEQLGRAYAAGKQGCRVAAAIEAWAVPAKPGLAWSGKNVIDLRATRHHTPPTLCHNTTQHTTPPTLCNNTTPHARHASRQSSATTRRGSAYRGHDMIRRYTVWLVPP